MKLMTKLLLIHWHYFDHEVIPFGKLNFLTGSNASGKSTIIDAMQLVLYGDTGGSFFNKSANGKGTRNLAGYLRCELGDDGDYGFKYLRDGMFTSYIALEFYDDVKNNYYTAGCCFDTYSENDVQKLFFHYKNTLPENEFVLDDIPMNISSLRSFGKNDFFKDLHVTDNGRVFRTDLYGWLGGLPERFRQLMKKAVSFNPDVDIQRFISEFVCDSQQIVDISQMQESIKSYKSLEAEEKILREKLELLEQISNAHQKYEKNKQDVLIYSYLINKAELQIAMEELNSYLQETEKLKNSISELEEIISIKENRHSDMNKEYVELQIQLNNNDQANAMKSLEDQIKSKENQIKQLSDEFLQVKCELENNVFSLISKCSKMSNKLLSISNIEFNPALMSRIDDIKKQAAQLIQKSEPIKDISASDIEKMGEATLLEYRKSVRNLNENSILLSESVNRESNDLRQKRKELNEEKNTLEKGIYQFPKDVRDLKDALLSRLRITEGKNIPVVIVSEAAEIRDKRWRNTIEGYLHTQKFYIIVQKEYFQKAIKVYDDIKRKKSIYRTGIVDIGKLEKFKPVADAGSLAEEIETKDPNVRLFLDYTLGHVMKCNRVTDLRNHRTAVTDEGMLYQNFVVRAMNPQRWEKPAIGQNAVKERLEAVKAEIKQLDNNISTCKIIQQSLDNTKHLSVFSENEASHTITAAKNMREVPFIEDDIDRLKVNLAAIDDSGIKELKRQIDSLNKGIKRLKEEIDKSKNEKSINSEKLRRCLEENIPKAEDDIRDKKSKLSNYEEDWIEQTGDVRYNRELLSRGNAVSIKNAFPRELSRVTNAQNTLWDEVRALRSKYNNDYKMGHDINIQDNSEYDDLWYEFSENRLPEYITRIQDTKNKAFEEFREDFLSRLSHNIDDSNRQINGLNNALRGYTFGEDNYRFRIVPKSEYKRYYDMITDPMKLEGGYNLFSEQFNIKYKEEIDTLFEIITNGNLGGEDYEKRVRMYTDYRTYLSFDLEVTDKTGYTQRLSRTMGKKSGGETQTPFYIAVLASFAQIYRIGYDKKNNTARLIIFDEAFSKMDGTRIARSIELLRQFNFQVLLSAPPEKIGNIVPHMDNIICTFHEGQHSYIRCFNSTQVEELL